jgi:hypothetical protein
VEREVKLTTYLVVGALLVGLVLQVWIPPGAWTLVAAAFLASMVVVGVGYLVPGRLRQTICGFRFIATLLFVLAVEAILGTLILQLKHPQFYLARYGGVGKLIVALRFDDIFHGLPFALLMALFGASVIASSTLRWPVKVRNAGFFIAHLGLLTSLAGAGASATLAIFSILSRTPARAFSRRTPLTGLCPGWRLHAMPTSYTCRCDRMFSGSIGSFHSTSSSVHLPIPTSWRRHALPETPVVRLSHS